MTDLFLTLQATTAAYDADALSLEKLNAMEAAERAYNRAVAERKAEWETLQGENRGSAIDNAFDTEGTAEDELFWLEVAIRSYHV